MTQKRKAELDALCLKWRMDVLTTLHRVKTGHPGGSLSAAEILAVLYMELMDVSPQNIASPERDVFILSKGHAAPMLYRALAEKGFLPLEEMDTLRQLNSRLQGHPCAHKLPGVEMSTGPLGLGLGAGLGMALAKKLQNAGGYVYVLMGDGEMQEGVVWEAAMAARKFHADNLIAIGDINGVQLDGTTEQVMPMLDIGLKFEAFGWNVMWCDGHDAASIAEGIRRLETAGKGPSILLCRTVKGKGVSFMEGQSVWHGRPIGDAEYRAAMLELEGKGHA